VWSNRENKEYTLQKFVEAAQNMKIKQATKSKTKRLASNALLGPSKRRKRRMCWNPLPSDTPSDLDTKLTVHLANDSTEEDEQDADCVYCTGRVSEDHKGQEWIRCATCFRWAHTLYTGMEEAIFRDKYCFVLSLYPSYL
jgi:hypothetical protein